MTPADVAALRLPSGFHASIYTSQVPGARSMTLGDKGTLFVGTRDVGNVYAVVDADRDGRADRVVVIARGLHMPNGVAFHAGALYVAEVSRILRFDDIEARLDAPPAPIVVTHAFPEDVTHGWKFIAFGPDGLLYVPVGAPCNVCDARPPYATVQRMRPDGTGLELFARGVRNTLGFDWDPQTRDFWFTDNGRDRLGEDIPADELNHATAKGQDFGFPYCHAGNIPDPTYYALGTCAAATPPACLLGPHVAALGMRFYNGTMFPASFARRIFIAEHGSWNRSERIGYRVTTVTLTTPPRYEVFAEGWLEGDTAWGRPVDVQVMPDGALAVSDDRSGAILRIRYGQ